MSARVSISSRLDEEGGVIMSRWLLQPVDFKRNGLVVDMFSPAPTKYFRVFRRFLGEYELKIVNLNMVRDLLRNHHIPQNTDGWGIPAGYLRELEIGGAIWLAVYRRRGRQLMGCVSIKEMDFRGGTDAIRVGYVDNLTVREDARGCGISWLLIWGAVEIGDASGVKRYIFCNDEFIGTRPWPPACRIPVRIMRDRLFADMSWIEGVREYVMRYIDDDLKAVR